MLGAGLQCALEKGGDGQGHQGEVEVAASAAEALRTIPRATPAQATHC